MTKAPDGYFHPQSVEDLRALVESAHARGTKLRVRGSGHSVPGAVYNDGFDGRGPVGHANIEVMLDRLRGVTITPEQDGDHAMVEVDAGCHLGKAPYEPTGTSTWENSLNHQLHQRGYALADLGGISHQTVSGFMLTGSSGGSIKHSASDGIVRLLLIDGTGRLHDLRRDDADPKKRELFQAARVSMGLLGVVAKVWFRAGRTYDISGQEITTSFVDCPVDLTGDGDHEHPSFAQHLAQTDHTRVLWWPQHDFDRVQVWQARRQAARADFEPQPFRILTPAQSLAGSLFMTILGNLDDLSVVEDKLADWYVHLEHTVEGDPRHVESRAALLEGMKDPLGRLAGKHPELCPEELGGRDAGEDESWAANALFRVIRKVVDGGLDGLSGKLLGRLLKKHMPSVIDELLGVFVEMGEKSFSDSWLYGLPMDNQMDDQLWPTEFTELWIPIHRLKETMQRLCAYYAAGGDQELAYQRTRSYGCELYAAKQSSAWLSPGFGGDCFRVNPFWFSRWAGTPAEFFAPVWDELRDLGFRPHWGKHLPPASQAWREHYRRVFPKLEDFLKLRAELDPKQIFVTSYWREHLGIAG